MKTILDCPFDKKCENISDDKKLHRCRWYIALSGKDPQSEKEWKDKWRCVFEWIPTLLVENAQTNRGQSEAIESLRNDLIENQKILNSIIGTFVREKLGEQHDHI